MKEKVIKVISGNPKIGLLNKLNLFVKKGERGANHFMLISNFFN